MNGLTELCLWQDGEGALHALSPTGHKGFGALSAPKNRSAHEQTLTVGIDAADLLPKPLWDWLALHLGQPCVLLLDASLPRTWHTLAWETLNWRGKKLGDWLRIVRYATKAGQTFDGRAGSLVWDQWPGPEFKALWPLFHGERRFERGRIETDVRSGRDVGHFARLVIIAHGGESDAVCLLDQSGEAWHLQLPATLPPEVLILACTSYQGNVHDMAVHCLERGARAVICGHGQLNAELMAGFLGDWLQEHADPVLRPYKRLWHVQGQAREEQGGVRWLRYYGEVALHEYYQNTLDFLSPWPTP